MNILFVCSMAEVRSKTASECLGFVSDYCGTDKLSDRYINPLQVEWADRIICMENSHSNKVIELFPHSRNKIQVWNIQDRYEYLDNTLITILRGKSEKYLDPYVTNKW